VHIIAIEGNRVEVQEGSRAWLPTTQRNETKKQHQELQLENEKTPPGCL